MSNKEKKSTKKEHVDKKKKSTSHKKKSTHKETKAVKKDSNKLEIFILAGAIVAVIALAFFVPKLIGKFVPDDALAPQNEQGVLVVSVNGEGIYSGEIEKRMAYYQAQYGPMATEDFVINQSVNELLLLQEAKEQGIVIDEGQIDLAVSNWLENLHKSMSEEQLNQLLASENLTLEEYTDDIRLTYRKNFYVYTLLNETVLSKLDTTENAEPAEVTDEELLEIYNANPNAYNTIKVRHILICYEGAMRCTENITKEEALEVANGLYDELVAGADFAELAKDNSNGPSGPNGGELDWFAADGSMVKEFETAAFALKHKNQFSKPVETAFGYHLIKLDDKKDSFEDVKTQMSMQIQLERQMQSQQGNVMKQQEAIQSYIESLKEDSVVIFHKQELTAGINPNSQIQTFSERAGETCMEDGKPVVYMFSTTWCPHCKWISETYESTVQKYVDEGKIVAYHYELDIGDDTMTPAVEQGVPPAHEAIYRSFNPRGSIPTFVFGCRYYRVGNGYESEQNLAMEANEFAAVIEELLA